MNTKIKFGTDGFRGILGENFNKDSVKKIIMAIAEYLKTGTILIGYDPRQDADKYAKYAAEIFAEYGFEVFLSSKVVPTPVLAFAVLNTKNSAGAVMFTASHNPKEYLGIKFIPNYGGPATTEITTEIERLIEEEIFTLERSKGIILKKDFSFSYFLQMDKLIDFRVIKQRPKNIIYDGLFSASIGYFDRILKNKKIDYEIYNNKYDPNFGGFLPEPKKANMKHYKLGYITFANDGDADRYGVIDEDGNWVSPNVIMAILLKYLKEKGNKGALVKTVGVSRLVDVVAEKLDIPVIETPVGFKWIGEKMRETETILGGEDSGGLSIGKHISEKDGIFANFLILEAVCKTGKSLSRLEREISLFAGVNFYQDRVDIKLASDSKKNEILSNITMMEEFAFQKIIKKVQLDGVKFFLEDDKTSVLIRKSGTEPLLRFYIESDSKENVLCVKEFIKGYMFIVK